LNWARRRDSSTQIVSALTDSGCSLLAPVKTSFLVDNEGQKQIWGFQNEVQRRERERNRGNIRPIFGIRNVLFLLFTKYC
jgi:hypothetical protein